MSAGVPISFVMMWGGAWLLLCIHLGMTWWNNPAYGYGLFVPPLCIGLLWHRRSEIAEACDHLVPPPGLSHLGRTFLLLGALVLLPIELLRQVSPDLRSIGILGTIACFALTVWALRQIGMVRVPPVIQAAGWLFLTAVPWPSFMETAVIQGLMKGVAAVTADLLNLMGILAISRGNLIELRTGLVSVEEACSGVRSLQSCLMAGVALALFFRLSRVRAVGLILFGIVLAWMGNVVRTLLLTYVSATRGSEVLQKFHDPAGVSILISVTLLLYFLADWLERSQHVKSQDVETDTPISLAVILAKVNWRRLPSTKAVCTMGMVSILAAHLWFWGHDWFSKPQTEPLLFVKEHSELNFRKVEVPQGILDVLNPESGAYYHGYSPKLGNVAVYSFFWLPGSDRLVGFFHRPDVCMTGVGWSMMEDARQITVSIDGWETKWYIFRFSRAGQQVIQAWGVWRDGIEQDLNFARGWRHTAGQQSQRWSWILHGRRTARTEILSVLLDNTGAGEEALRCAIQQSFAMRRGSQ